MERGATNVRVIIGVKIRGKKRQTGRGARSITHHAHEQAHRGKATVSGKRQKHTHTNDRKDEGILEQRLAGGVTQRVESLVLEHLVWYKAE